MSNIMIIGFGDHERWEFSNCQRKIKELMAGMKEV